jgi:hypothetical protein
MRLMKDNLKEREVTCASCGSAFAIWSSDQPTGFQVKRVRRNGVETPGVSVPLFACPRCGFENLVFQPGDEPMRFRE